MSAVAGDGRLAEEAADLVYHLYVLLAVAGADVAQVEDELARRARSGRAGGTADL